MLFPTFALAALFPITAVSAASTGHAALETRVTVRGILQDAIDAANGAKAAIDKEVQNIEKYIAQQKLSTFFSIEKSLVNIESQLSTTLSFAEPLIVNFTYPLADSELDELPAYVQNVNAIVADIETVSNAILASKPTLTKLLAAPEVVIIIGTANTLVQTVTTFANQALTGQSGPVADSVRQTLSAIASIIALLIGPIIKAFQLLLK
ncbi:hypothetical protein F5Y17DRAFT_463104 [Xylariaceae sp. FL0594]|nr:hypothetical protein F5Y17DRAFT_463104 [Xylariaceae sp. FL0594]